MVVAVVFVVGVVVVVVVVVVFVAAVAVVVVVFCCCFRFIFYFCRCCCCYCCCCCCVRSFLYYFLLHVPIVVVSRFRFRNCFCLMVVCSHLLFVHLPLSLPLNVVVVCRLTLIPHQLSSCIVSSSTRSVFVWISCSWVVAVGVESSGADPAVATDGESEGIAVVDDAAKPTVEVEGEE